MELKKLTFECDNNFFQICAEKFFTVSSDKSTEKETYSETVETLKNK